MHVATPFRLMLTTTALLGALATVAGPGPASQPAASPLFECYTVATNPPVGSHKPQVTVCRPGTQQV